MYFFFSRKSGYIKVKMYISLLEDTYVAQKEGCTTKGPLSALLFLFNGKGKIKLPKAILLMFLNKKKIPRT